jgi:hypothetical protein
MDFSDDPKIVEAITTKLFVDDYLSSAPTVEQGIQEAKGVMQALSRGDMHLQGWLSNSSGFLRALAVEDPTITNTELSLGEEETEKVLGIHWKAREDLLTFRVNHLDDIEFTPTGLASKVASLFDPQGMAAPVIVKAKIKLRELNTQGLNHSDAISDDDRSWWERWFDTLRQLNAVEIPRCLFPNEKDIVRTEIHGFGDASEEAHAAVVYLRHLFKNGEVVIRQVRATTKLAPKKTISIPKLELNAALQTARLMMAVEGALTRKAHRRYLWTDSSTVRNWIRASASKYQVYVSHRVGEIQTLTEPSEWRFVPGRLNPADVATRSFLE